MRIRLLGHFFHLQLLVLALVELLAFCGAMVAAEAFRWGLDWQGILSGANRLWWRVLVFGGVCSVSFLALGLYTARQRIGAIGVGLRIAVAMLATLVVVSTVFYAFPNIETGRSVLLLACVLTLPLAIATRTVAVRLIGLEGFKKRVLVYGESGPLARFRRMRRSNDRSGFNLVGVVHPPGDPADPLGETVCEAPRGLKALCLELNIDELVVAVRNRRDSLPVKELLQCRFAGISVVEFISFMERETGRFELDLLNPSWIIFGEGFRRDGVRKFTARALDFFASGVLVVLASPIMLLAGLAIWLEDGRNGRGIFYRQNRVGFEGRVFPLIKFRSMRVDAEAGGAQWAQKQDPRVTRVGSLIRRTRIDELPQLLNILRGHMGFVGPRPERPEFVAQLEEKIPYYSYRHSVKPGLTGWAQLCFPYGSSIEDARQKLQYDLYYVKHHNLLLDLTILVQTVEVVLMGKGAR
jgi:sugar transferase (PEP-CTERM system associated)